MKQIKRNKLLYSGKGYYCIKCKSLCSLYEQGLSCRCGNPWDFEVCDSEDYPIHWILVTIEAKEREYYDNDKDIGENYLD